MFRLMEFNIPAYIAWLHTCITRVARLLTRLTVNVMRVKSLFILPLICKS